MTNYAPTIPAASDLISVSQAQIQNNFEQLNTQFGGAVPASGGDHDGFYNGTGNGSGMHNQVTFTADQTAPSLTRNGVLGVSGLYTNTVSALSQLFFQNTSGSIQLTGAATIATPGSVTLPGGIILKWGSFNITATSASVVFSTAFPAHVWGLVAMPNNIATGNVKPSVCAANSLTTAGFTAVRDGTSGTAIYTYIAIGN